MTGILTIAGLYNYDNTIFDNIFLPTGVDKQTLINNICGELFGLELLYPDAVTMKIMIEAWSCKELPAWEKLHNTTLMEYDPISNYDRIEEWTDEQTSTSHGETKSKTAGFNSGMVENGGGVADTSGNGKNTHKGRIKGNIGVTTTQQMIEEERRTVQFNIYDHIINQFKQRFCLLVY